MRNHPTGHAPGASPGVRRGGIRRRLAVAGASLLASAPLVAILPAAASAAPAPGAGRATSMVAIAAAPRIPVGDVAIGAVPASTIEGGAVMVKPRDEAALTSFIANVTNHKSPLYHHYLSRGAYLSTFGPTAATISAVEASLRSSGLKVLGVSGNGELVSFSGTAAHVEGAFGTGLERYRLPDGTIGLGTTGAVHVPSSIAANVVGVLGLDNLVEAKPTYIRPGKRSTPAPRAVSPHFSHPAGSPNACPAATSDALTSGGLTDDAIAHSYGAFGLYNQNDFGSGESVAVFELQPFLATDIETFDTCYFGATEAAQMSGTNGNLTGSRLHVINVDGGELQPGPGSQNDESTLDIEDVSALAPESTIDVYEAPNTTFGLIDQYVQIIQNDQEQLLTSSWLIGCEQLAQLAAPGIPEEENIIFQQAAAQGQTVFAAAGDTGDDTCNTFRLVPEPPGQNLLSESDTSSQPYVLSAGGTSIDNATEPPTEHVWNDGAQWGGAGGGVSEAWTMPAWQRPVAQTEAGAADVTNAENLETADAGYSDPFTTPTFCDGTLGATAGTPCREVPDVSAEADEFTGSITIYGQSLGYGNPNGWATIGGTSSAAPLWAAMLTLVNGSLGCSGDKINGVQNVGFAAPILYGIAGSPAAYAASFNDITSGNNDVYGLDNGTSFPARTGYDMASGLGTPQLTNPSGGNGLAYYMCNYGPVQAPPTVSALNCSGTGCLTATSGSTAGGQTLTVTGTGFGTTAKPLVKSVQVGSGQAVSFTVTNNTTLQVVLPPADATVPPGSPAPQDGAGPAMIAVTSSTEQSSLIGPKSLFLYVDANSTPATVPAVTGVSPYGGLDTSPGGAAGAVTVFGSGFSGTPTVDFGNVAGTSVHVVTPYELTVVPPKFSSLTTATACPADTGTGNEPLSPTTDICQVQVTVTAGGLTSATGTILAPYEGPLVGDSMGAIVLPPKCKCEDEPAPTEFDYIPAPSVTSVSTGTIGDLPASAGFLASEFGGAATNTITISGTGMDPLTFSYATLGLPADENSIFFPMQESGTSFVLLAPAILSPVTGATNEPVQIPVGFTSLAGPAPTDGNIVYAGVPVVTGVVNTNTGNPGVPAASGCPSPPPAAGCESPLALTGSGFIDAAGPIQYVDFFTGFSLGLQNNYTVNSDTSVSTESLQQNPTVADVVVCSVTGCAINPPADDLYIYPPGNPSLSSIQPASGPAHGSNTVSINGSNLGCVIAVKFGNTFALQQSNAQALLRCGQTNQVLAMVPPGAAGSKVKVTIITVESEFTHVSSNSLTYTYTPSTPSAAYPLDVVAGPGEATVSWSPPASNGGSPITHYYVAATSPGRATVAAAVPFGTNSYVFKYLQPGVPWQFSVVAVSKLGAGLPDASFPTVLQPGDNGYLVATANGAVFGFGSLATAGGSGGGAIAGKVVGIAATPDGLGYFEATSTGRVYNFGDAGFYGEASVPSGAHIVGIASTNSGLGYWLVSNTGTVYGFGDARGFGSWSGVSDVVGIAPTPFDGGYYLDEANGTVKAFGAAVWKGDMKGKPLHKPLVGIAVNPVTGGYWLLGGDGGIFAFGGAGFYGSMIGQHLNGAAVGMVGTPDGKGYWIEAADNGLFTFGAARYAGNAMSEAQSAGVGVAI